MNTKVLMIASSFCLASAGIACSFLPQELLAFAGVTGGGTLHIGVQLAGALYVSYALLNWVSRSNLIGGIYSRPIASANMLHFAIGAAALVKGLQSAPPGVPYLAVTALYALFAVMFGIVLFGNPLDKKKGD